MRGIWRDYSILEGSIFDIRSNHVLSQNELWVGEDSPPKKSFHGTQPILPKSFPNFQVKGNVNDKNGRSNYTVHCSFCVT